MMCWQAGTQRLNISSVSELQVCTATMPLCFFLLVAFAGGKWDPYRSKFYMPRWLTDRTNITFTSPPPSVPIFDSFPSLFLSLSIPLSSLPSLSGLPSFVKSPEDQTGISGGVASFVCQATGEPKPRITWMKKGKKVSSQRFEVSTHAWLSDLERLSYTPTQIQAGTNTRHVTQTLEAWAFRLLL